MERKEKGRKSFRQEFGRVEEETIEEQKRWRIG